MKKTFLICSLGGRIVSLIRLIDSIACFSDWNVDLVLQNYPEDEVEIIKYHTNVRFPDKCKFFVTGGMTGPHLARCIALDRDRSDVWCILDDDMYAVKGMTDYDKMAEIIFNDKSIGLLSSNWRKNEKMLASVKLSDKLQRQSIVYTGGGMMMREDVADIIRAIPRVQYLFDNPLWSIYSYVNGYDNCRFMGSAAVHEICTKGGRRKWISENNRHKALPPAEWIRTRKGKGEKGGFDEYLICEPSDITELAKQLHNSRKAERK